MSSRRPVEAIEFVPPETGPVLAAMSVLAAAGDGWVNLLPGVPEEAVDKPPRTVFSAFFGSAEPPVTMCTWVPGRRGEGPTVGVVHPRGRGAVRQLAELGAPVPPGWRVRQDHARRGLVVRPPAGTPDRVVLEWLLRAGEVLAMVPLTGSWQARVHLPLGAQPRSTTS
jgi:hypothetical protein